MWKLFLNFCETFVKFVLNCNVIFMDLEGLCVKYAINASKIPQEGQYGSFQVTLKTSILKAVIKMCLCQSSRSPWFLLSFEFV